MGELVQLHEQLAENERPVDYDGAYVIIINVDTSPTNKNWGRILLVKDGATWGLPGGKIEEGEEAARAAEREIEEEAGIKLEIPATRITLIRVAEFEGRRVRVHLYGAVTTDTELSKASKKYKWVWPNDVVRWNDEEGPLQEGVEKAIRIEFDIRERKAA